jgi:apolipoprotein N-acyltransferase
MMLASASGRSFFEIMTAQIICFISGVLLTLAFPRTNAHWLAWFALSPLMYYIYRLSGKRTLLCGAAFGFGFFGTLLFWITIFGKLPFVLLVVFQTLFIVGFTVAAKLIGGRLEAWGRFILLPTLWTAFEWVRSLGLFGFTWGDLGYSQYKVLPLIQMASITGVWGISFLLVMSNAALANLAAGRKSGDLSVGRAQVALVGAVVLGAFIFGRAALIRTIHGGPPIRAAIIQGNISEEVQDAEYCRKATRAYDAMTQMAAASGARLIVWPETVVPGCLGADLYLQRALTDLATRSSAYLLVGGWHQDMRQRWYNTAFLFAPRTGFCGRYSKVHLVPYGEYVPARKYTPFVKYYGVKPYDTSPGPGFNLIRAGSLKIGTAICFESIFPDILRRMTADGANLLCVITDDQWFKRSPAAEQHMAASVLRAVENRRYLVRGAATGISCIIDPHGRILARADIFRAAILQADVRTLSRLSFFTRHGSWAVYLSVILTIMFAGVAMLRAQRKP